MRGALPLRCPHRYKSAGLWALQSIREWNQLERGGGRQARHRRQLIGPSDERGIYYRRPKRQFFPDGLNRPFHHHHHQSKTKNNDNTNTIISVRRESKTDPSPPPLSRRLYHTVALSNFVHPQWLSLSIRTFNLFILACVAIFGTCAYTHTQHKRKGNSEINGNIKKKRVRATVPAFPPLSPDGSV